MYVLLQKIVKPLNFWNSLFAIGALYKNIRTFFYFHTVIQDAFFATKKNLFQVKIVTRITHTGAKSHFFP